MSGGICTEYVRGFFLSLDKTKHSTVDETLRFMREEGGGWVIYPELCIG